MDPSNNWVDKYGEECAANLRATMNEWQDIAQYDYVMKVCRKKLGKPIYETSLDRLIARLELDYFWRLVEREAKQLEPIMPLSVAMYRVSLHLDRQQARVAVRQG